MMKLLPKLVDTSASYRPEEVRPRIDPRWQDAVVRYLRGSVTATPKKCRKTMEIS